jgi:hypothetical protein
MPHRIFVGNLVSFNVNNLTLSGDITIRMFHQGVPLFRCQFNTLFVEGEYLEFGLSELDEQNEDPKAFERKYPQACKLRVFFLIKSPK